MEPVMIVAGIGIAIILQCLGVAAVLWRMNDVDAKLDAIMDELRITTPEETDGKKRIPSRATGHDAVYDAFDWST